VSGQALHESVHDRKDEHRGYHEGDTAQSIIGLFAKMHGAVVRPHAL
jgi:hypothetical protein